MYKKQAAVCVLMTGLEDTRGHNKRRDFSRKLQRGDDNAMTKSAVPLTESKFKKALNVTDKICCTECIILLHAPYALFWGKQFGTPPSYVAFSDKIPRTFQCSPSDNVYIEQSSSTKGCGYHVELTQP